jgi:hypothetical protein
MAVRIQIVCIVASIIIIISIFELIRRKKIKEEYSLLWFFIGFIFLFFSIWRGALESLSYLVGIGYPPSALILVMIVGILLILVHFSMVISKLTEKNKQLIQEIGLFKFEFEEFKKMVKNNSNDNK